MESRNLTPSVLGDIVLAWGPGAGEWVESLGGFTAISAPQDHVHVAVRGAARHGSAPGGARWAATCDLIAGDLDDGARALTSAAPPQADWRGRFAYVSWHEAERRAAILTDHISTLPLFTLETDDVFAASTSLRILASAPWCKRAIDRQSIYHFLNFAQIPAPGTIFKDIRRLEPATRVIATPGKSSVQRYFAPEYPEDLRGSESKLTGELRDQIVATVRAYKPASGDDWGCFLSGGTDSSSIVSILARDLGRGRVKSFSIGFAEAGFDELGFARIAAEACGASATFSNVSREQAQALVSRVIDACDQPFGNASMIPTLGCTELAREHGVHVMLAGDGGDEIFGGNERYAKDKVMEAWFSLPAPVKAVGRKVGSEVGGSSVHFLNRVENFFERASLPNPERFYTDDSFASDHYEELLRPEFRAEVQRESSLDRMREIYRVGQSGGPLHRIMRLDLNMAIAQNDVPKVHGSARAAGVTVRFPYLDQELIRMTGRLPENMVVRRLTKRFLFKRAMQGILPEEILKKKKQGFGLPTAVWLKSDTSFKGMVRDVLFDARTRARGIWEPAFVEKLLDEHERGSWDHADSIWRLLMLELWLRRYVDARV
jgi:asparagine synthase (glutamine-hydrolysing)